MNFDAAVRIVHVTAGVSALALGAVGMSIPKTLRLHPRLGNCYFVAMSVACTSAILIAVSEWARLWYFLFLAVGTYAFGVAGYVAGKRRKAHWLPIHVIGLTSSYCGLVMAFLVSRFGITRILPGLGRLPLFVRLAPLMFMSTCIVAWTGIAVVRGRLPKRSKSPA
jgi:uncharacterized membrane protein